MTLPPPAESSLAFEISPGLQGRLAFVWCGDRYAQQLEVIRGRDAMLVLSSWEIGGGDPWPASPPLQQLSFHHTPQGRPCALLVGMAGRNHWSLSVEQDEAGALRFDVACRVHRQPGWLGSSYLAASGVGSPDGSWTLPCDGGAVRLAVSPGGARSALVRLEQPAGFAITPQAEPVPWPSTLRWKYRLQLTESAGTFSGTAT